MILRLIIFLVINFGALGIGGIFTGKGVPGEWYQTLNKAPWTPPGWVFGAAWTLIMICLSVYMAWLWPQEENKRNLVILFVIQWILNVSWNPVFFYFHQTQFALAIIVGLTLLIGYFILRDYPNMKAKVLLLAPYFIWMLIATSLNAYVVFRN